MAAGLERPPFLRWRADDRLRDTFATHQEALANALSHMGLSSGESETEYEDEYGPDAKLRFM
jgi:hypothetical protein